MGIGRQRWLLKISMEDLVDYAHDFDRWSIWTNAILDVDPEGPEHASLRATNYYRQDQD